MRHGKSIVFLLCAVLLLGFQSRLEADVLDPEAIKKFYRSWSEEDKTVFENVILPSLQKEFRTVVYNPHTGLERRILGKRAAFYQLYRSLTEELSHQNDETYRRQDHYTKVGRSTLRLIMHAMASNTNSIYYGIPDNVYDELFAEQDDPMVGFRQLTYEPLLLETGGVPLAISFAAVATVLIARALPDRRARAVTFALGGLMAIFGLTGCVSPESTFMQVINEHAQEDQERRLRGVTTSFLRISHAWHDVEREHREFQKDLYRSVVALGPKLDEEADGGLEIRETNKRQLYAASFATIILAMNEFLPNISDVIENDDAEDETGDGTVEEPDDGTSGGDEGDPPPTIDEEYVWGTFKVFSRSYLDNIALLSMIMMNHEGAKTLILEMLMAEFEKLKDRFMRMLISLSHIIYETHTELQMNFDHSIDRRDMIALRDYLLYLRQWTVAGINQEGMPGLPVYQLLTDAERRVVSLTTRPADPWR